MRVVLFVGSVVIVAVGIVTLLPDAGERQGSGRPGLDTVFDFYISRSRAPIVWDLGSFKVSFVVPPGMWFDPHGQYPTLQSRFLTTDNDSQYAGNPCYIFRLIPIYSSDDVESVIEYERTRRNAIREEGIGGRTVTVVRAMGRWQNSQYPGAGILEALIQGDSDAGLRISISPPIEENVAACVSAEPNASAQDLETLIGGLEIE